jgi:hypothetical protein
VTTTEIHPQPRVDTIVRIAPTGEERRRTEYLGHVWFDGRPVISGMTLSREQSAPRGIRVPTIDGAFFLPDSLPYDRQQIADSQLSVSTALRASRDGAILEAGAAFVDDPSGSPTWVQLRIQAYGPWPFGISYRVVALTPLGDR